MKEYELSMWEAAKNRDVDAFLQVVNQDAVMVCGGYRCTGAEYAQIIREFDIAEYKISEFEVIAKTETLCQIHYVIETTVSEEKNKDLEGKFYITSTWEKNADAWKLIFNMDSRIS